MERQGGLPRAGIAWTPEGVEETIHMAMAGRKDWVQADLRCLMCGRVIGRLVGPLPPDLPVWIDSRVMARERIVLGGGSRSFKVIAAPAMLLELPRAEVVEGLAND